MKLSIIIPCFNEAKNIPLILERFAKIIQPQMELLLVNNGSTDNSAQVLNDLLPNYTFARVVEVKINQGYGFGIVSGLKQARGEFLSYTHADLQTDPADVIKAYGLIIKESKPENCFIKGDRKNRALFDQVFTWGMSLFESVYLGKKLWDINAQPNLFHRNFFAKLNDTPNDFSLDLYFLYKAKIMGLKVIRFKVLFPPRIHGTSSWNTGLQAKYKFIKRTLEFSFKLKGRL